MKTVAYTNTKQHAVHIGNRMIMPGDTREVDASALPDYQPEETAAVCATPGLVEQLATGPVKDAINALSNLNDDDLQALADLEMDKKQPRSTLIEAIAKEQFNRAQLADLDDNIESFEQQLKTHNADMLNELATLHKDDENLLQLINAEIARRAGA